MVIKATAIPRRTRDWSDRKRRFRPLTTIASGKDKDGSELSAPAKYQELADRDKGLTTLTLWVTGICILLLSFQQVHLAHQEEVLSARNQIYIPKRSSFVTQTNRMHITSGIQIRKRSEANGGDSGAGLPGNVGSSSKELEYLLYITTVFSPSHQEAFRTCWPELMLRSELLRKAHVMVFSNNETEVDASITDFLHDQLFAGNPSFEIKFPPLRSLMDIYRPSSRGGWMHDGAVNVAQLGANEAVHLGFTQGWFAPFPWIIRVNPDVLIRNGTWILETMQNPDVDGIFVDCAPEPARRIHTDFFAVRPSACRSDAFDELVPEHFSDGREGNHEMTAYKEFRPIIDANRHRWLPDTEDSKTFCRVRGPFSSVTHYHDISEQGSTSSKESVCTELVGWNVT